MKRETIEKWAKLGGIGLVVFLVLAQFVPVERTNPPVGDEIVATPEVMSVLRRSCYDCHSNETEWPGYSRVAPISWLVSHDVKEGRSKLNYSEWGRLSAEDRDELLEETWEEVGEGEMPPAAYVFMHQDARLSDADRAVLRQWAMGSGSDREREEDEVAGN